MGMGFTLVVSVKLSFIVAAINSQDIGSLPNNSHGCRLSLNNGLDDMAPKGDPLLIHNSIKVLYLRDIPDSGGTFAVDMRSIVKSKYISLTYFVVKIFLRFFSLFIKWQDNRHIEKNVVRNVSCNSNHVEWTKVGQFWLPILVVWDVLESV